MKWTDVKQFQKKYAAPEDFLAKNGFTLCRRYNGEKRIEKILKSGTFASCGYSAETEDIPYLQKAVLYKNPKEKKCCLAYMPYMWSEAVRAEIEDWAMMKKLKVNISNLSWDNSELCLVIISLPEINIQL